MTLHRVFTPFLALLVAGCTNRAIFVTSTDIGIKADVTTEQAHIGYGRTELFQGPSYPDAGSVPEVVGYLGSNCRSFRQRFAKSTLQAKPLTWSLSQRIPDQTAEKSDSLEGAAPAVLWHRV